jgi:CSLREA domain-containing protein
MIHLPRVSTSRRILMAVTLFLLFGIADAGAQVTYTVTTATDIDDGTCDAHCTLREAINAANGSAGADRIEFNIPGGGLPTISTNNTPLPAITDALTIDGYTQPGIGATPNTNATGGLNTVLGIELVGGMGSGIDVGLTINAGPVTVRGLIISHYTEAIHVGLASDVTIAGNFIGTNIYGTTTPGWGLSWRGIVVEPGAANLVIGGSTAADRNLIAGHTDNGIQITRSDALFTSVTIAGNLIGTTADGMTVLGNLRGINIDGSGALNQPDVITIGGATASLGNVISGNAGHGIEIDNAGGDDPAGTAITIEQNYIGVAADGSIGLGNTQAGVSVSGPTQATVRHNWIVQNSGAGVAVNSPGLTGSGAGVLITENRIFANGGLGIDLNGDGRTPNDAGDMDVGPNAQLNFPVLTQAGLNPWTSVVTVTGTYAGLPSTTFTLELFVNNGAVGGDPFLTSVSVTTDGTGTGTFSVPISGTLSAGQDISATFSHPNGYTSEFSDPIAVVLTGKTISGTVLLPGGQPVPGVDINITDGGSVNGNTTTDANGAYSFGSLAPATYVITPSMAGVVFTPADATVPNLTTDQVRDFTATPVPQIYTVNTADDVDDGVCDASHCSLREAIMQADGHPGADTIAFNIAPAGAVHTIVTTSNLPPIFDPVLIDGFTQPGSLPNTNATGGLNAVLKIELVGGPSGNSIGFFLFSGGVTIRGLAIGGYQAAILAALADLPDVTIAGNYLGTGPDGLTATPDSQGGFIASPGGSVTVGGTTPAARNLIAGHVQVGMVLYQGNGSPSEIRVQGNLIGTDATGQQALGNGAGVVHEIVPGTPEIEVSWIGGPTDAERNVISGNMGPGIVVTRMTDGDAPSMDRHITNNYIGVAADGVTSLGNFAPGIVVDGRVAYRIDHNVIAHNAFAGITTSGGPADDGRGVVISQNQIYGNDGLAIDLGDDGRTANDPDDSDTGANDLQNFPVLIGALENFTGGATLTGELHSLPNRMYTIEVFTTGGLDEPGVHAKTFVGETTSSTNASGLLEFSVDAAAVPPGEFLVATATDMAFGKTSEVSDAIVVTAMARYGISGTITLDGAALPGVAVRIDGSVTLTTTTDGAGHYVFANLPAPGSYVVAPSLASYVFTPQNTQFNGLSGDTVADFAAALAQTEQHLAEGATGPFWQTSIFVLNPTATPTTATLSFLLADGSTRTTSVPLTGPGHAVIDPALLPGLEQAMFSTVVRAVTPIVASRTMHWGDGGQLGAHAEQAVSQPRTTWYFGEGATGCFKLFYLFVNPNAQPAEMTVTYVRRAPETPVVMSYVVPAFSRYTVPVNDQPGLAFAEVAAQIEVTNGMPIVAERAMYSSCYGASWRGGHESAAAPSPTTSWYLAEGATGSFFDLYILLANFKPTNAQVDVRYLLADGSSFTKPYVVPAHSRLTIDVGGEDARLASTSVGAVITSTNAVPIVVERSQWWPHGHWYEGHASAAAPRAGVEWQLAGGEAGGPRGSHAYLLIANTSADAGQAQLRLVFDDGTTADLAQPVTLAPYGRTTLDLGDVFPAARGKTFGVIVESLGATPAPIVVELSIYNDTTLAGERIFWGAGTNVVATRVR